MLNRVGKKNMNYSVIIAAAGKGTRMGLKFNKMFLPIEGGKTILEKTLSIFLDDPRCKQIVIVTNPEDISKLIDRYEEGRIVYVMGGKTRQESVYHGLKAVTGDVVFVHDGARPWLPLSDINNLLEAMKTERAAILGVKAVQTIKEVHGGYIKKTIPRQSLYHAQTPQAFETKLLIECHELAEKANFHATDDAQLVENFSNVPIKMVEGSYTNTKITTIHDLI
jgi:2-C-methyl-D-erythritol 4-phosphate cytidylyltransferase